MWMTTLIYTMSRPGNLEGADSFAVHPFSLFTRWISISCCGGTGGGDGIAC
ncbi:hypothetical protein OBV_25890 [Oscillibacter valericigenes Sjm18-20]|nr:hypothetical protein OBV_25890 [Oscillibacter valericigenes Sjm18-20]